MKISKLKAITIASSFVGSASLASVVGATAGVVLNDQSSDNQNYSQNGNGNNNNNNGTEGNNSSGGGDSSTDNSNSNNGPIIDQDEKIDWSSIFPNKKVIDSKAGMKAADAVNQINSIDDLWNFYSKPANIPLDYTITLNKVTTYLDASSQTTDLLVQLNIQNSKGSAPESVQFLIYGFSNYSSSDYKQYFESANSNGVLTKKIDPRDLSTDASSPNYFANFYKPVVPQQLTDNNISVTPQSFSINGSKATFTYLLSSSNQQIKVNANAVVSGFYTYPAFSNSQTVNLKWKPANFDFIKSNLPANYTRTDFDSFIWKHWNNSILGDAINAYRYWYLLDQSNLTSKLKSYVMASGNGGSTTDKIPIGFLIRGGDDKKIKSVSMSPTYDSSVSLNGNKSYLKLNWHLPNWKGNNLVSLLCFLYQWTGPLNINGNLNIGFDSNKPASLNNGLVQIPVTITTDVVLNNYNYPQFVFKKAHDVKTSNWNVLDGLYYYFKNSSTLDDSYSTPFFSQFSETLKKRT